MSPADANAIEAIWAASPGASRWSAQDALHLAQNGTRIWVAEQDGQIAGAAALLSAGDEAEILNIGVAPAWRRRGVGRELMTAAIRDASHAGATRVFLEVRESNAAAREFYRSLGYVEVGRRALYYRDPAEDALVLSRSARESQP